MLFRSGTHLDGNGDGVPGDNYVLNFFSLTADLNHDHTVNFSDALILIQHYGATGATYGQGDINGDGTVNFSDVLILIQDFNHSLASTGGASSLLKYAAKRRLG